MHSLKSAQAWQRLVGVLQQGDQNFTDPMHELDTQGLIDGYRHLAHLLSYGFDFYLESDPLRPALVPLASPVKKILGDNVDSSYFFTQLRGNQSYRIWGRRYNSCYLSFAVYGGEDDGSTSEHVVATINHTHMEFDADGRYEFILTPDPKGPQQFKLDDDSQVLITREYFTDPAQAKKAEMHIENLNPPATPGPITDEELARRLNTVATFVEQTLYMVPFPVPMPVNSFGEPFPFMKDVRSWGLTDNVYCFGKFRLQPDEYVEIRFKSPPCNYWGIQTWNHMMQSMDYRHHKVSINNSQAKPNADGSYTIRMSMYPSDLPNSFTTGGYSEGMMFVRWLLAEGEPEQPETNLKKF